MAFKFVLQSENDEDSRSEGLTFDDVYIDIYRKY